MLSGFVQATFVVNARGVVLIDAPSAPADKLPAAIRDVTENGDVRLWDAREGTCLKVYITSPNGGSAGWAVFNPNTGQGSEAAGDAWHWLVWQRQAGQPLPEILPLETYGEVPWSPILPERVSDSGFESPVSTQDVRRNSSKDASKSPRSS